MGDTCVASVAHCHYCFDVLVQALEGGGPSLLSPLFVSWYTVRGLEAKRLRGCIGTFTPQLLPEGLAHYALQAALHDQRFPPIRRAECDSLVCTVSMLGPMEPCRDAWDWVLGVHGVYVVWEAPSGGGRLSATFLPDVAPAQGWNQQDTIDHALRKAGWRGAITDTMRSEVSVRRYKSSTATLPWAEYQKSFVKTS